MATEANDLGKAEDYIKAGLRAAGAASSASSTAAKYYGNSRSEGEDMVRAGVAAAGLPPLRTGLLPNNDDFAKRIGDNLIKGSEARIAEQRPREPSTEPAQSAEEMIRAGLGSARHRQEAAAQAKAAAAPKVRRSWR